ncbi:hypothetical protein PGIGA_G00140160 [Pangasianodon gigas]|uniref:Uncharacterized protein n=1 Tax=Pangasianodon gigas TaxID=30993 RepID=A0ACC5XL73_PANGG|nr:hypothetical protein [Pangasianodon gigas]
MGCNSSTHTTAQDTTQSNSKSDSNGASTTGTAVEKAENDLDIDCGAEAAESLEAPEAKSESNTLHTAAEPTPAEDQAAGAPAAGQPEETGLEEAPGQ